MRPAAQNTESLLAYIIDGLSYVDEATDSIEIANQTLDELKQLRELLAVELAAAWDDGFKQGGPMHDDDGTDSHRINPHATHIYAWENDCGEVRLTPGRQAALNLAKSYNGTALRRPVGNNTGEWERFDDD